MVDDPLADLEAEFDDVVIQDVEVIPSLDAATLLTRFAKVERDLRERGEMMHPRTDTGRELHSARAAMLIELTKRRMR